MIDKKNKHITVMRIHDYSFDESGECSSKLIGVFESQNQEEIRSICTPEEIRLATQFESIRCLQNLLTVFQYIFGYVDALSTEHPNQVHRHIVDAAIANFDKIPKNIDIEIKDKLARELVTSCKILRAKLRQKKSIFSIIEANQTPLEIYPPESGRVPPEINIVTIPISSNEEKIFLDNEILIWDKAYMELLSSTGPHGKKEAKKSKAELQERYFKFKNEEKSPLLKWFNYNYTENKQPFHASPLLQILVIYIYKDKIEKLISFNENYLPAYTTPIHNTVNIIHRSEVIKSESQIKMHNEGEVIGELTTAAVNPFLFQAVFRGAGKFKSVLAHRVFRFLPTQAFNQKVLGINPCNILEKPGGYAQIARELKLTGKRDISDIKDLLHAMAYLPIKTRYFCGNLIVLGDYHPELSRNQYHGIKITLGPEFSPYYASRTRDLLVPVVKAPQLVKIPTYYAHQYLLQNEIMAEFSNQSKILAEHGFIKITDLMWEQLAKQCNLPLSVLKKVKSCWTQDNDDGEKFLDQLDKEIYTLGPAYSKEREFLTRQGQKRIRNSEIRNSENPQKKFKKKGKK